MRFTLIFSLLLYTLDIAAAETRQDAPPRSEAEQLFATAMRFELDGENRYRNMTLRAAMKSDRRFCASALAAGRAAARRCMGRGRGSD